MATDQQPYFKRQFRMLKSPLKTRLLINGRKGKISLQSRVCGVVAPAEAVVLAGHTGLKGHFAVKSASQLKNFIRLCFVENDKSKSTINSKSKV